MPRLSDPHAMAGRFPLSTMQPLICLEYGAGADALPELPPRYLRDGRNDFPGQPLAVAPMVSCDVAADQPEDWDERLGVAARTGPWKLSDSLDLPTQAEAGNGTAWPGIAERRGRG